MSREDKERFLESVQAEGVFSEGAAETLLEGILREADPALRKKTARAFYILFYDFRGQEQAVLRFLLRTDVAEPVKGMWLVGSSDDVGRHIAQVFQIVPQSFGPEDRERLAQAYLPMLLEGLRGDDPDFRQEILVALEAFRDSPSLSDPRVRAFLRAAADREADPVLKDRMKELLGG